MCEKQWRFPHNSYTNENGLDTSDMEMFKKDPISSLAREICQNSIDAACGEKPVRVEFNTFSISREDIPDVEELAAQISACYDYKKSSPKEGPALENLKKEINKKTIQCLRISDFNTTGLEGAATRGQGTPFYNLTKGSGVSDKAGSSGGSKGIGKFASFVVSSTNTVFYSTKARDGSCAHIGISKLRSTPISKEDPDLLTMGIGYYGLGKKNAPILEEIHLDPSFTRGEGQYGTDVYIIGFNVDPEWQNDIIAKVLESFMVAIIFGELEVKVGEIIVNKDTVKDIIYDKAFQKNRTRTEICDIKAQFELLQSDASVTATEIPINENNSVRVYLKQYTQQNEKDATKRCVMVRYPYMKINYILPGAFLPFSALCIIPDNDLNKKMRVIENPQHTKWEMKRLNDFPVQKKETNKLYNNLKKSVREFIESVLRESSGEATDIEGAGEFLPSQDTLGSSTDNSTNNAADNKIANEQVRVYPIVPVKAQTPKTVKAGENGESYEFAEGDLADGGEGGKKPQKNDKNPQPNPDPKIEPKDPNTIGPGNSSVLKKVPLNGMRYRTVVTDKAAGKYDCIFTSLYNENDCEFAIRLCGEATDKYPVEIISAQIDGNPCNIQDGKIVGFRIVKGKTHKISYSVKSSEMFASEVILSANR